MTVVTENLGGIQAMFVGITEPTNTNLVWYDTNAGINKHKYYDILSASWIAFVDSGVKKELQTLTDAATITWDYSLGFNAQVTLTATRILDAPTNIENGDYGTLKIIQGGAGGYSLTLPASFKVINGGAGVIALSSNPGEEDILSWYYDGTSFYVNLGTNYN